MNTVNVMNPMNNLSFFKLPLIFIGVFFVIYYGGMHATNILLHDVPVQYLPQIITSSFFSLLLPLFLFFVTAIFCCQKYRLHSVANSGLVVGLIGLILAVLYFCWGNLYGLAQSFVLKRVYEDFYSGNVFLWISLLSYFMKISGCILFVAILCFLFYLMANKNATTRSTFPLEGNVGSRIYATIYSVLVLFLTILFISFGVVNTLPALLKDWGYSDIQEIILFFIPIVVIFLIINYMLAYFATRDSFKRIDSTLMIGKLILTVLITYVFNFYVGLAIGVVIALLGQSFLLMAYYMDYDSVIALAITLFVIANVIHFILLFILSRLSVKIMYS